MALMLMTLDDVNVDDVNDVNALSDVNDHVQSKKHKAGIKQNRPVLQ